MSTVINLFPVTDRLVFVRLFAYFDSVPISSVYVNNVVFLLEFDLVLLCENRFEKRNNKVCESQNPLSVSVLYKFLEQRPLQTFVYQHHSSTKITHSV